MSTTEKTTRILISIGLLLLVGMFYLVPMPGINHTLLSEMYVAAYGKEYHLFSKFALPGTDKMALFAFGIRPLLYATGLTIFFAGFSPQLNKLPAKTLKRKLTIPSLSLSFVLLLFQAFFVASFLGNFSFDGNSLITIDPIPFTIISLCWHIGGFLLLLTLLRQMRIHGITSGIALYILVPLVITVVLEIIPHIHSQLPVSTVTKFFALFTLLIGGIIWLLQYKRNITISAITGHTQRKDFTIRIPLNLLGILPLFAWTLPNLLAMLLSNTSIQYTSVAPLANSYTTLLSQHPTLIRLGTIIIASLLIYLFNYPHNRILSSLRRFGYSNNKAFFRIKETLRMSFIANMAILISSIYLLEKLTSILDTGYLNQNFIALIFIIVILSKKVILDIKRPIVQRKVNENHLEEFDTTLEAELLLQRLSEENIEARIINSRFIEFTGTTALWALCHPLFITGSVYPFLDNGSVTVVVPQEQYEEASALWAKINSSAQEALTA